MPPRYAYWTILVDGQPTAFRSGALEDLMPTFNRLKQKQPTAEVKWFQNGQLWPSRLDAQNSMRERGARGREGDFRQGARRPRDRDPAPRRSFGAERPDPAAGKRFDAPAWKPKGAGAKPEWRAKGSAERPVKSARDQARSAFRPKPFAERREERPAWVPKSQLRRHDETPAGKPKGSPRERRDERQERPEWKPKGSNLGPASTGGRGEGTERPEGKRKWVPKAEYKKSRGIEAKRDSKWRPGGEHKDPRQKYKDAKKAKWTRFKQTIRARSGKPRKRGEE